LVHQNLIEIFLLKIFFHQQYRWLPYDYQLHAENMLVPAEEKLEENHSKKQE
jgi:hypothetical protein